MSKRDFFILLIKIFGLYSLVISVFSILPSSISYLNIFEGNGLEYLSLLILGVLLFVLMLFVTLLRKSDKVVDFLKLERGFDSEEFKLNGMTDETIIKLASLIFGAFYFLEALPAFINYTLTMFETKASFDSKVESSTQYWWFVSLVQMLIGAYLVVGYKNVQQWILRKS